MSEGTLVRKKPNLFGYSLTYSYLCSQIIVYDKKKETITAP